MNYDYTPPFNPYGNRGMSEDASTLQVRISGILDDSKYSIVLGGTITEVFQTLHDVLKECSTDNWDGYGARAIDMASYSEALRFLHFLPKTLPTPEITAEPDGEIAFEWFCSKRRIFSVSIGGKGELTYAGLFGFNKTHGTEFFGDEFPKTILDNIQRVFT
jgi:hypothetical protein